MKSEKTSEFIEEFTTPVLGIITNAGLPVGIIIFHNGKIVNAKLDENTSGGIKFSRKEDAESISIPAGMTAKVALTNYSKNVVNDFQMYRESVDTYEVKELMMD